MFEPNQMFSFSYPALCINGRFLFPVSLERKLRDCQTVQPLCTAWSMRPCAGLGVHFADDLNNSDTCGDNFPHLNGH